MKNEPPDILERSLWKVTSRNYYLLLRQAWLKFNWPLPRLPTTRMVDNDEDVPLLSLSESEPSRFQRKPNPFSLQSCSS